MRVEPFIDPQGVPRERERAAYNVALVTDGDRRFITFMPEAEGLTCLEFVRVFSIALKPGTDPEVVQELATQLAAHLDGLDAVYMPEPEPRPTYPNIVRVACGMSGNATSFPPLPIAESDIADVRDSPCGDAGRSGHRAPRAADRWWALLGSVGAAIAAVDAMQTEERSHGHAFSDQGRP